MTTERAMLFLAAFDDVYHAHAAQQVRALQRLGVQVTTLDLGKSPTLLGRLTGRDVPRQVERALAEHDPELVVVSGGAVIDEPMLERLRAQGRARWIIWLPDDLRTVAEAALRARPYDHIYATGTDVAAEVHERLARTVDVLAWAADPSVYRPLRSKGEYRASVVFAGRATPRRERLLSGLVRHGLAIWGPGWRKTSLKDYCRGEVPSTAEYIKAYGGATVAINIHHMAVEGDPREVSCNQRLFELAALGLPQVVDDRGDLARCFAPDREVLVFHDAASLQEAVQYLLEEPERAEALGAAARARLLHDHTYMHRMRHLLLDQPRRFDGR